MTARTIADCVRAHVVLAEPGTRIRLASGREAEWYADLRKAFLTDGRALGLAAEALYARLPEEVHSIGGVPTAGLPLMGALLALCHERDDARRSPRRGFYTRVEPKRHGLRSRVEGFAEGIACLVEDTVTTGGSVLAHAQAAREAGADPRYVLALLDREEGAAARLREAGLTLLPCLRASDVL